VVQMGEGDVQMGEGMYRWQGNLWKMGNSVEEVQTLVDKLDKIKGGG
jgi:hypothetical protein